MTVTTTHIVTSHDGIRFSVQFESLDIKNAAIAKEIETHWAAKRLANELDNAEGYHRITT